MSVFSASVCIPMYLFCCMYENGFMTCVHEQKNLFEIIYRSECNVVPCCTDIRVLTLSARIRNEVAIFHLENGLIYQEYIPQELVWCSQSF